jgi:hypothetical protein
LDGKTIQIGRKFPSRLDGSISIQIGRKFPFGMNGQTTLIPLPSTTDFVHIAIVVLLAERDQISVLLKLL